MNHLIDQPIGEEVSPKDVTIVSVAWLVTAWAVLSMVIATLLVIVSLSGYDIKIEISIQ